MGLNYQTIGEFFREELRAKNATSDRRKAVFVLLAFLERTARAAIFPNEQQFTSPIDIVSEINSSEFAGNLGGACSIELPECQQIIDELCKLGFVTGGGNVCFLSHELIGKLRLHYAWQD